MHLTHVTYAGPPIDDVEILTRLPKGLAGLLQQLNGFIQFHGGLHVRGACLAPAWHSLRDAWLGENAFHRLYPEVEPADIPFAQDCLGDQFLLREQQVWRLLGETGELEALAVSFREFLEQAQADPVEYLSLAPLLKFQEDGGTLEAGQQLSAYPPFCMDQSAQGVHLAAVPAEERRRFLANLAAQIRDVPDGGSIEFKVVD